MWVPELAAPGAAVTLEADAAHHVVRVCRARPGDRVTLTDGRGRHASAVREPSGSGVLLRIEAVAEIARPAARILIVGAPEGERADWLIEKAVELGITALWPADTERAAWRHGGSGRDRWLRLARAALGQSRRAWLPELAPSEPLDTLLTRVPAGTERWLADPEGVPAATFRIQGSRDEAAVVGPAVGFSTREKAGVVEGGFRAIRLSGGRLRAETAALALAAWWATSDPESPDTQADTGRVP